MIKNKIFNVIIEANELSRQLINEIRQKNVFVLVIEVDGILYFENESANATVTEKLLSAETLQHKMVLYLKENVIHEN